LNVKLQLPKTGLGARLLKTPLRRRLVIGSVVLFFVTAAIFIFYYNRYASMIQDKLEAGPFADMTVVYSAPRQVTVGETISAPEIAAYLRRAGYSNDSNRSRVGWYRLRPDGIEVNPGPAAYDDEGAVVKVASGKVTSIVSLHDNRKRTQFLLEPEVISNVFDKQRNKRRIVRYEDIPAVMKNALLSAEDKNFFSHPGFDPFGILRAAYRDITQGKREGASTITQQLARTLWLGNEAGWGRKIPETLITLHLEQRLTKEQIFEYYSNSIDLGHQSSFWVRGFAQAAQAYFGKELSQIEAHEAAMLAGLPQGPSIYDPFRHPERALTRRNIILRAMHTNSYLDDAQLEVALSKPLSVIPEAAETSDAPYFVDLVTQELGTKFADRDFSKGAYKVYTTLDMDLQRDAVEAVRKGIKETDAQWTKRNKAYGTEKFPKAQVALIALDTQTGEILAMQGGRSYGETQFNRALAKRQPGSSFKPFVYAAALSTGLDHSRADIITPATSILDEPTTFWFDGKPYNPKNHGGYRGDVTLRYALAHSLNIPAVKLAQKVGYGQVVKVARNAGMNLQIRPTPSIALGSYEVTPLEIAGAYTIFANNGKLLKPSMLKAIRASEGGHVFESKIEKKQALDPRVAYLTYSLMQEVLRSGTGAGASKYGFHLPAAGKTGTSFDGWFVGFTSRIICAVWVGFDDNRDFELEGARSALPIWGEFMARAHKHREYSVVHTPPVPDGIVTVTIDATTGELAGPSCPRTFTEHFIAGTQPQQPCHEHGGGRSGTSGGQTISSGWDPVQPTDGTTTVAAAVQSPKPAGPASAVASAPRAIVRPAPTPAPKRAKSKVIPVTPEAKASAPPKPKSVWERAVGLFK
jgi:penicillin-binding protein 1B